MQQTHIVIGPHQRHGAMVMQQCCNTRLFVPFLRNVAHRSLQQLIKEEVIAVYFKCIFEDKIKRDDNNRLFWSETGIYDTVLKFSGRKLVYMILC